MLREVDCTVCGKSMMTDASAGSPLCTSCRAKAVSERLLPAPQAAPTAIQSGPPPGGAIAESITATPPRARGTPQSAPSAGSPRFWIGYAVALALTIGGIVSAIVVGFRNMSRMLFEINIGWICLLNTLTMILAILLVFPIVRHEYRIIDLAPQGERTQRTLAFIFMLLVLTPFALAVVFFAVCSAAASVMAPAAGQR